MPLVSGAKLGPYEVAGPLGAGGMGEVHRARDTRLGRDVAIKLLPDTLAHDPQRLPPVAREAHSPGAGAPYTLLPDTLAHDPQRLLRFEREAKLLAAVHHANVATLFGLEEHD